MWCKTHVLPLQSKYVTSSYHIFKNKHNHAQSILILSIRKSRAMQFGAMSYALDKITSASSNLL